MLPPLPDGARLIGDVDSTRTAIYDSVLDTARNFKPWTNNRHTMQIVDVDYEGPERYTKAQRKRAEIEGTSLTRKLRGTYQLIDNTTGDILDQQRKTLAQVPVLTDDGTFLLDGTNSYLVGQTRMRPGGYTRRRESGELESHMNVARGVGHRYYMDPESGVFKTQIGGSKTPLLPLLRTLGATDDEIKGVWGDQIFNANQLAAKNPDVAVKKLAAKLSRGKQNADRAAADIVREAFESMNLDPEVSKRTLGDAYDRVDKRAILAATKKLMAVRKGEVEGDDRDALEFQVYHGPEDIFSESLRKQVNAVRKRFWAASRDGTLDKVPVGAFSDAFKSAILNSGLGQVPEMVNPLESLDGRSRVTRMGAGGISNTDAIPDEARMVHPSHLGFIDPIFTPESLKIGVDTRLGVKTAKGKDGTLYSVFRDMKNGGKLDWVSPRQLAGKTIAFPGELSSGEDHVSAIRDGRMLYVGRDEVDFEVPTPDQAFSPLSNLVPFRSNNMAQRASMVGRFLEQSLPLVNREAPLVQTGISDDPDGRSYEEEYGKAVGAIRTSAGGMVKKVTNDEIVIRGDDGQDHTYELEYHRPTARKTQQHNTPLVKVGQYVEPGQLVASSNFTDDQGVLAIGRNAKVGYLADGHNFEDAFSISRSFAKAMRSEGAYRNKVDIGSDVHVNRDKFRAINPSAYTEDVYKNFDEDGLLKPGTVVNPGDPLILAVKETSTGTRIGRKKFSWQDASVKWEHDHPGVVTDSFKGKKAANVVVRTEMDLEVGDKLCYDDITEVMTNVGWTLFENVTPGHKFASKTPEGQIVYLEPDELHEYDYEGPMYWAETARTSLCVTPNHYLYCRLKTDSHYSLHRADKVQTPYTLSHGGQWEPEHPILSLESEVHSTLEPVDIHVYAAALGLYVDHGWLASDAHAGPYSVQYHGLGNKHRGFVERLSEAGLNFETSDSSHGVVLQGKEWVDLFEPVQACLERGELPEHVWSFPPLALSVLVSNLFWEQADGSQFCRTVSTEFAGELQRLAFHAGYSASIRSLYDEDGEFAHHEVVIHPDMESEVQTWDCGYEHYSGKVYCVTLPEHHVLFVRRRGRSTWCGNSGRHGNKGVISKIYEDHEMPTDANGEPFDILMNPQGLISRGNASQVIESLLGKAAKLRGEPYKLPDFSSDARGNLEFAINEVRKYGGNPEETIIDPETGAALERESVAGYQYITKLHHMAECYDDQTEVLTRQGWKFWSTVTATDELAVPGLDGTTLEFETPIDLVAQEYSGTLYCCTSATVDYAVTPNHELWAAKADGAPMGKLGAETVHGQELFLTQFGFEAQGDPSPEFKHVGDQLLNWGTYCSLVGYVLTAAKVDDQEASVSFSVRDPYADDPDSPVSRVQSLLHSTPFTWLETPSGSGTAFTCKDPSLFTFVKSLGSSVPRDIVTGSGSGRYQTYLGIIRGSAIAHAKHGQAIVLKSQELADSFQELAILTGVESVITRVSQGWQATLLEDHVAHVTPGPGVFHTRQYTGTVYCAQTSTGLLLVRRNGKPLVCGNSKLQGRGIGGYDAEGAPSRGGTDGCFPFEQEVETLRGPVPIGHIVQGKMRVSAKARDMSTGKWCYRPVTDWFVRKARVADLLTIHTELGTQLHPTKNHNLYIVGKGKLPAEEVQVGDHMYYHSSLGVDGHAEITAIEPYQDPEGREYIDVYDITVYDFHTYVVGDVLVSNSKKWGLLNTYSLISHGAYDVLADAHNVRGQRNETFFRNFLQGNAETPTEVPFVYEKFLNQLRAAGINPVKQGTRTNLMAMTDKDVDELAGDNELKSAETVDWNVDSLNPRKGGLFDPTLTGGHGGKKWAKITLTEPVLNPVMEEPTRRLLGLTKQGLRDVIAGKKELDGKTGHDALHSALKAIDVPKEIQRMKDQLKSSKITEVDEAVRRLTFLRGAEKTGVHPKDWMITKIPVLPPAYRPVSLLQGSGTPMVADVNHLYQALWESNDALKSLKDVVSDVSEERLNLYNDVSAVVGLTEPRQPKLVEQKVKGILGQVLGGGPKASVFQRKLLSAQTDMTGRGVISPNPDLEIDEVGIPVDMAWSTYKPFIVRRLSRKGVSPIRAAEEIEKRSELAFKELEAEMAERPALIDRAPVLHKHGMLAMRPKIVPGKTIQLPPLVYKGAGADNDGDAMQLHVPVSQRAVKNAERMLPSRNLRTPATFKAHMIPPQEFVSGLATASGEGDTSRPVKTFASRADALAAYRRGDIGPRQRVNILDK